MVAQGQVLPTQRLTVALLPLALAAILQQFRRLPLPCIVQLFSPHLFSLPEHRILLYNAVRSSRQNVFTFAVPVLLQEAVLSPQCQV